MSTYPFWLKEENTILRTQLSEKTRVQHNQIKPKETPFNTLIVLLDVFKPLLKNKNSYEGAELNTILIFLYICKQGNKGVLSKELGKSIGLAQSTVSRNLLKLSEMKGKNRYTKQREEGWGLVKDCRDPYERRRNKWFLTSKGEALKNKIDEVF